MDNLMFAFLIFIAAIFISRKISSNALSKLNTDKKSEVIDLFSNKSTLSFIFLFSIVVLFFLNIKFEFINRTVAFILYCIIILAYTSVESFKAYDKLKSHDFPITYIKSYILSSSIRIIGILIFFLLLWQ